MFFFKKKGKSFALWLIIILSIISVFHLYNGNFQKEHAKISLSDFVAQIEAEKVQEVTIKEQDIYGIRKDGTEFSTHAPRSFSAIPLLLEKGVQFKAEPQDTSSFTIFAIFQLILPLLFFGGILFFFFRQVQNNSGKAIGFGKSRAKLSDPEKSTIVFDDVAGIDEAKKDLQEIVEFLKEPQRFQKIGARVPKGVLLVGPPGTGKTLLAKAIAGEAKVPFFSISGSDFVEIFVGVGASRVRDLFAQAKQSAPCIVFIDEIDAVGRHRGVGIGGGNDEREQTLNQLLVEMDGFDKREEVIVVAATNRADVLDPALLRPGRFDRQISVGLLDIRGREKVLRVHLKNVQISNDVNPLIIARGTPGFSGAELANLVNEAALRAAQRHALKVEMKDLERTRDKMIMGPERRFAVSEEEKRLTAYHEAGHAVVAYHSPGSNPIYKATIEHRGESLGMVVRLPEDDQLFISKKKLDADMAVAMGGRAAEEMIFGKESVTTGAASDFQMATKLARNMVVNWGMSDALGPIAYGKQSHGDQDLSDELTNRIDEEVRRIVEASCLQAKNILSKHREHLDLLASALLKYETLTGEDVKKLFTTGNMDFKEEELKALEALEKKSSAAAASSAVSKKKRERKNKKDSTKNPPVENISTEPHMG